MRFWGPGPRDLAIGLAYGAAVAAAIIAWGEPRLRGLGIDLLVWMRHQVMDHRHDPAASRAVVIAIDEETYRRPPFREAPDALWTPQLGRVLSAVLDARSSAVGIDLVYSTTADAIRPGYDAPLLQAIHKGAADGRIVLGRVQHQRFPIEPHPSQVLVVGGRDNIRALNLIEDEDGIIRRVPAAFTRQLPDGTLEREPSMAFELAARAGARPLLDQQSTTSAPFDGISNGILINFDTTPGSIPTYSLADLYACAEDGNLEYFERHFGGRVVLVGGVLDVEDRKLTSMRLATSPEGLRLPPRCRLPAMTELYSGTARDTIPGVHILATAVNNILIGNALQPVPPATSAALIVLLGLAAAVAPLRMRPGLAGTGLALLAVGWTALAFLFVLSNLVLPCLSGLSAIALTAPVMFGYRVGIIDRQRRQILQSFGLYLPKSEVERLATSQRLPALGGEVRQVSILFADIADFTSHSERSTPTALVTDLNTYFDRASEIIESHGGFIDKFIGDAIMAVFGAPTIQHDHVRRAAAAAIALDRELSAENSGMTLAGSPIRARIGLSTGPALVGNIGASRRFSYTVIGDTVNLASRIEGANKLYGTSVLISGDMASVAADLTRLRLIDRVRVLGRQEPVELWEPVADSIFDVGEFDRAFSLWAGGHFVEAIPAFETLAAASDPVSARFASRCRFHLKNPPQDWDGVTNLDGK